MKLDPHKLLSALPAIIVFTLLLIWVGLAVFQAHVPPKDIHPGQTVYFLSDYLSESDGQMCRVYSTQMVSPIGRNGGNWWDTRAGFGYSVYLIDSDGGYPFNYSVNSFVTELPSDLCYPIE